MIKCLNCGSELTGVQKKYCSRSCAASKNNVLYPKKESIQRDHESCILCGKQLGRWSHGKYCSRKCANSSPERQITKIDVTCGDCGIGLKTIPGRPQSICSRCRSLRDRASFKKKCLEVTGNQCVHCKKEPSQDKLVFHHVDESTKKFDIGPYRNKPWNEILAELAKCIVLCSSCHRKEHTKRERERKSGRMAESGIAPASKPVLP